MISSITWTLSKKWTIIMNSVSFSNLWKLNSWSCKFLDNSLKSTFSEILERPCSESLVPSWWLSFAADSLRFAWLVRLETMLGERAPF